MVFLSAWAISCGRRCAWPRNTQQVFIAAREDQAGMKPTADTTPYGFGGKDAKEAIEAGDIPVSPWS
jgi:hypothetical protein